MDTQRAVANDHIVRQLEEARQRTRWLLSTVSDEDLSRQHDPIMSPLVWGYGHIGNYEELRLLEKAFGKRLPTEEEWEKAASWDPETGTKRLYPWGGEPPTPGTANLGQTAFGPAGTGAYPAGASAYGILGIIGDVWEWTASDFAPYPGFESFPYREYSEIFFGPDYKVLRGGSWATRPHAIRNTFRNWDYPIRRQLFVGFRCAK
jgi:formylglycine-generating enzyme required for sulfatase activity